MRTFLQLKWTQAFGVKTAKGYPRGRFYLEKCYKHNKFHNC